MDCSAYTTLRGRAATLPVIAVVTLLVAFQSSPVWAQMGHGAAVLMNCEPKCYCTGPSDCDDAIPCTDDICDPDGLGNVMECIIVLINIDQFEDTYSVTNAFDVVDWGGNAGFGPLLVSLEGIQPGGAPGTSTLPVTYSLDIIATEGVTTCVPGGLLPCELEPGASVTFIQDIFPISDKYCGPLPGIVNPSDLPCDDDSDCDFGTCRPLIGSHIASEGGVVAFDQCNGIFDETCSDGPIQITNSHQVTPIAECCENPGDLFDAPVRFVPGTLNKHSQGTFIEARIDMRPLYSVEDIDPAQPIMLSVAGSLPIQDSSRQTEGEEMVVSFPREEVQDASPVAENVEFLLSGEMEFDCDFEGIDHVRIIEEGQPHSTSESNEDPSTILDDAIRGSIDQLGSGPDGDLGVVDCLSDYLSNYRFDLNTDPDEPIHGETFFYLYKFCNGTTSCTYGQNSAGTERYPSEINGAGCP